MKNTNSNFSRRDMLAMCASMSATFAAMWLTKPHLAFADTAMQSEIAPEAQPYHELITRLADIIIPKTDTAGAIDAGVPQFIQTILKDWYSLSERQKLLDDLANFDDLAQKSGNRRFLDAPRDVQHEIVKQVDESGQIPSFADFKAFTVFGFYTSEVGANQLDYTPVPGVFKPCTPVTPKTRAAMIQGIG